MTLLSAPVEAVPIGRLQLSDIPRLARRHPLVLVGGSLLVLLIALAIAAPLYAGDPVNMDPFKRLQPPYAEMWFGSDNLGRDVFARTIFGARISLVVGLLSAACAALAGLLIGIVAGYSRSFDNVVMRVMDGLMSIPTILLAIALISLTGPGIGILIVAIAVPETPAVARLVRSVVLGVRERPYVEAALCGGARLPKVLWRHILPSTIPALMVQGATVCASAILTEAGLSFLGVGVPPEIPSWGNMIASSRLYLAIAPMTIFAPGICLAVTVLAVNLLGDGLRDLFDPRAKKRR
ncbi:ABC-type dipeptide/oligopeptide/nickel transport system, permease component [Mesorhizobium australicum WSM2073]|uniref:ABC-type dipeptide/oligopeptide/nickel transport system, permease component n=3 Tax=Mesorhizobium TaxID=68287 RepID=L0KVD4_MESAW|nr:MULTISPECIES: ABC transporter permease [Mesorhizobium]ADV14774.1 binding-protein-dependent transport systems inner membrane component [Mesorhizobium ciceri biovar biserrulae WSM1271]AEH90661.1 binding-protein-dependent transport systems inner membrane component [Mesorhizobium opportunistum WSM2075]AGB48033.1 ABC-type dipeptide/oligopeptide/nickel transport system, permease component [Mesorhizobium australicum WSM2073]OBP89877.1 peptide ABC transporter permease [Mesorhizobium loti]